MIRNIQILLLGLTIFLVGCDNPVEDINIVVDTDDIISTTIAVEVIDALNESNIPSDASISITGTDAAFVLDITGERDYEMAPGVGLITLILHPDATPSLVEPVQFTINVESDGYESFSRDVTLTEVGNTVETIAMVNRVSPPADVQFQESNIFTNDRGELENDFVISNSRANGRVKNLGFLFNVLFPAGTIFKDENGNTLVGQIDFKTRIANGLNALGGFERNIFGSNGNVEEVIKILSDAQLNLEITVGGIRAFTTSKNFLYTFDFDSNFNPDDIKALFQPIGENPEIYDNSNPNLSFNNGKINFNTNRFGILDLSPYGSIIRTILSSLQPVTISISSNIVPSIEDEKYYTDKLKYIISYKSRISNSYRTYIARKNSFKDGSQINFLALPGIEDYKIEVISDFANEVIASSQVATGSSNTLTLNVDNDPVRFSLIGTCNGGDLQVGATATIYYRPSGTNDTPVILGTIQSGKMVSYKLSKGIEYEFSTRFNRNVVSAVGTITESEYNEMRELPANICDNF
ncbi:MAG: hypothetical protein AAGI07_19370 [Bacteroidota bacterium]